MKKTTENPLAYFITMRAYGTWLHGDKRLSVNKINNIYGAPKIKRNGYLEKQMRDQLKFPVMRFDKTKRAIIKRALENTCCRYYWKLHALHVRTNHVHIVLQSEKNPNNVMQILKANVTLLLRRQGAIEKNQKVWSHHGSTKYIWTECALHYASEYTIEEQGEKMDYVDNIGFDQ